MPHMTTPSPERLELKVQQLDNDVQAIYEMIARVEGTQRRHTNRFDELNDRLDGVEVRLGRLEVKTDSLGTRLDRLEVKTDGLDGKLDEVLRRLEP